MRMVKILEILREEVWNKKRISRQYMSSTSALVATGLRTSALSGSKVALLANPTSAGWLLSTRPTSTGLFNVPFHLPHPQNSSLLRNIFEELNITCDRVIQASDVVHKKSNCSRLRPRPDGQGDVRCGRQRGLWQEQVSPDAALAGPWSGPHGILGCQVGLATKDTIVSKSSRERGPINSGHKSENNPSVSTLKGPPSSPQWEQRWPASSKQEQLIFHWEQLAPDSWMNTSSAGS